MLNVEDVITREQIQDRLAELGFVREIDEHWDAPREWNPIIMDELARVARKLGRDTTSRVRIDSCRCRYGDVDVTLVMTEGHPSPDWLDALEQRLNAQINERLEVEVDPRPRRR
jgi:hypothetical protein